MDDLKELQNVMEKIFFPDISFPRNYIITATTKTSQNEVFISSLIITKDDTEKFFKEKDDIKVVVDLKRDEASIENNIIYTATFIAGEEQKEIKGIFQGLDKKRYNRFLNELKNAKDLIFWITDNDLNLIKVLEMDFDIKPFEMMIDSILSKKYIV